MSVSSTALPPLVGHAATVAALATLVDQHKLPHALLLHGPRGIGKALLARQLAYRLICGPAGDSSASDRPSTDMFGTPAHPPSITGNLLAWNTDAPTYHQLLAGACPDFHLLQPEDGKKSIDVKAVAALLETLRRSADTARLCLIDSIDDLTEEAANMLLKSLEEPRPGIYFILISHQLSRTLPTIRSRCRLFRLGVLNDAEVRTVLGQHQADESLVPLAAGCPGSVLGPQGENIAEKRLKLAENLRRWQAGEGPAPAPSTDSLLPALRQLLADQLHQGQPTLMQAEAYAHLTELARRQAELNLPMALTQEAALALVKP